MMASEAAAGFDPSLEGGQSERRATFLRVAARLNPSQGLETFVLLVAAVGVVAWTVREADWAETPWLMATVVCSCLAGLLVAKVRGPWPLLHLAALAIGLAVVVWQGLSLIESQPLADRVGELWDRLSVWYTLAKTGGISNDLLPFTLALLVVAWLLGYVSSWFLFRRTNAWVGLLLGGVTLLTVLNLLPHTYTSRFFVFMLFAMLLVARVNVVQQHGRWRQGGIAFGVGSRWLCILAAAGISTLVLVAAAGLPLKVYVSRTAIDIWNLGRSPIDNLEDEFGRLFAGLEARKAGSGRFFGSTLPFQGKISLGSDVVIWAMSDYPAYWLNRVYSRYTSQGWITGETTELKVGPESQAPPPQETFGRIPVTQTLRLAFDTSNVYTGGSVTWISRDAVVETLDPLEFEIDPTDPSGDVHLPPDIQELARKIRREMDPPPPGSVESYISMMLPLDLVLVDVSTGRGSAQGTILDKITLARKAPALPDVVTWRFADRIPANDTYTMQSLISTANEDELRLAGTDCSGFIKDHYLQLPDSLPQRVRDLAARLTRNDETPLDMALSIQDYLRGDTFEYSKEIEKPTGDGVDHLLFKTRKGYSTYFASAMAVMLRAVGVPARLAAGYDPGEPQADPGLWVVEDSDSHGWTQVYFPGYGWIDFEPTPRWPVSIRGLPQQIVSTSLSDEGASIDDAGISEGFDLERFCAEYGRGGYDIAGAMVSICMEMEKSGGMTEPVEHLKEASWRLLWGPAAAMAVVVGSLAGLWLVWWLVWTWGLVKATPTERAYTKMSRMATFAGIGRKPHQTPVEYASVLGKAMPAIATDTAEIGWAFANSRYGVRQVPEADAVDLNEAWRRTRKCLLALTFSRRLA